ncbi:MAG: Gfo/Idh/MocA family oxidoreductase [Phycisphaeraceae bacterium]
MDSGNSTRRRFMLDSAAVVSAASVHAAVASRSYAAGDETLRVGVVGCGGRGTGSAVQALTADANVQIVALGDVFEDRLENSLAVLDRHTKTTDAGVKHSDELAKRVNVPPEQRFVGFDAYKQVIDLVDVVILTTPPHFRPEQLAYAVKQGKHVFAEKPVATDSAGVRLALEACKEAKRKNLSVVAGLCWRYHLPRIETMRQVREEGLIGEPVAIETVYNVGGVWGPRRRPEQVESEMELQLRNWYYYKWLSGDHIVEQAVHALDTMGWVMRDEPPVQCWGVGGRQVRTDPQHGDIYDHFSLVFEYANGTRGYHQCRQWPGARFNQINDYVFGSKGTCDVWRHNIKGAVDWQYDGPDKNMYQHEQDELFASIRSGNPINDGKHMCYSTLLAIMGRMAAYTGDRITWEMVMNSEQRLGPEKYAWGDAPEVVVAKPGVTKYH